MFEGRNDLEKRLVKKLQNYNNPNTLFFVLCDQDLENCVELKNRLKQKCINAGKPDAIIRIACRSIESFYLGDISSIGRAYGVSLQSHQEKAKYRSPDELNYPAQTLKELVPQFHKILGARIIASELDLTKSKSKSFSHFITALQHAIAICKAQGKE